MSLGNILWSFLAPLVAITLFDGVVAPGGVGGQHSLLCYNCHDATDPSNCNLISKCGHGEMCSTEVHRHPDGSHSFKMQCINHWDCHLAASLFGRKRGPHHNLVCAECCNNATLCNRHLCNQFLPTTPPPPTTTPLPTTVVTTSVPTPTTTATSTGQPVYDPNCRDHEEDGILCSELDLFHMCTATSTIAYVMAHEKCKKHCGFCIADPNAAVIPQGPQPVAGACTNYEQDGFKCASLDLFHLCTDPSSLAYVLAHEKCKLHCGFCTQTAVTAATAVTATTTGTVITATPLTTAPTQAVTKQAPNITVTGATVASTTKQVCRDVEDNGFSCKYYDSLQICTSREPTWSSLAHARCSKHCGFCI